MNALLRFALSCALVTLPSLVGCSSGADVITQEEAEATQEARVNAKSLLTVADGKRVTLCVSTACARGLTSVRVREEIKLRLPTKDPESGRPIASWSIVQAPQGGKFSVRETNVEVPSPTRKKNVDAALQLKANRNGWLVRATGQLRDSRDTVVYAWSAASAATAEPECETFQRVEQIVAMTNACDGEAVCALVETMRCRTPGGRWRVEYDDQVDEFCGGCGGY